MQKSWYDFYALKDMDEDKARFYRSILAYRKPYFMRYIYPQISKDYTRFIKKCERSADVKFNKNLSDLLEADYESLSDNEKQFVDYYHRELPLGRGLCVMNKICYAFENRFDSVKDRRLNNKFDYSILKSNAEYSQYEYECIKKLWAEYRSTIQSYVVRLQYEKEDSFDKKVKIMQINEEFITECSKVCPNEDSLCDIVLDLTYNSKYGKSFAWAMCGDVIVRNLMKRFGKKISFPVANDDGDISFAGSNYELMTLVLED